MHSTHKYPLMTFLTSSPRSWTSTSIKQPLNLSTIKINKGEYKRMLAYNWRHKAGKPANRSGWNYVIMWRKKAAVRWTSIQDIPILKDTQGALIPLPTQHTSIYHIYSHVKSSHHRTEWQINNILNTESHESNIQSKTPYACVTHARDYTILGC